MKLLPWQTRALKAILNSPIDVIVLSGGYGSGKTVINSLAAKMLCERPDQRGLLIGKAYSILRDTVAKTISETVPSIFLKRHMKSPSLSWTFKSRDEKKDSEIISRTMQYSHECEGQLRSIDADFMWLFEANLLPQEAYHVGLSRLRRHGENYKYPILLETNPSNKNSWVYKTFIHGAEETYRSPDRNEWHNQKIMTEKIEGKEVKMHYLVINLTTYSNPFFPRNVIAQMKKDYSETEYLRKIMGIWCAGVDGVWDKYETFDPPKTPKDRFEYYSNYDYIFIGCDPGQTNPTAIVFIGYKDGYFEIFDEIVETNRSVRSMLDGIYTIFEKWGIPKYSESSIWVDPASKYWVNEFNEIPDCKIFARQSKHKGTDPALNRAMMLGQKLRNGTLRVSKECECVISDIEQTVYVEGKHKEKIDKSAHDPHAMDAVGYAMTKAR